jgi:hypothetical protein
MPKTQFNLHEQASCLGNRKWCQLHRRIRDVLVAQFSEERDITLNVLYSSLTLSRTSFLAARTFTGPSKRLRKSPVLQHNNPQRLCSLGIFDPRKQMRHNIPSFTKYSAEFDDRNECSSYISHMTGILQQSPRVTDRHEIIGHVRMDFTQYVPLDEPWHLPQPWRSAIIPMNIEFMPLRAWTGYVTVASPLYEWTGDMWH